MSKPRLVRHLAEFVLVACGKLSTQASLLLSSIVVARTAPGEFGDYAAALGLVALVDGIVGFPLDSAAVRFAGVHGHGSERTLRIQNLILRLKLLFGAAALALAWPLRDRLSALVFGSPSRGGLLVVALCSAAALLLLRGTSVFLQNRKEFRRYAVLDTAAGLARLAATLALFLLGLGGAGAYLSGYGLATLLIFLSAILVFPQPYLLARMPSREDAHFCLRLVGLILGVAVFGNLNAKADMVVATSFYGPAAAGQYAVAYQIAQSGTVLAFFAGVVAQPRIIPMALDGTLGRLVGTNLLAVLAAALLLAPLALRYLPAVLSWVFGEAFAPAAGITLILLLGVLAEWLIIPVMLPVAMQAFPVGVLAGEGALLACYAAGVALVKNHGIDAFAWLVAGNRLAHLAFYAGLVWFFLRLPPDSRRSLLHA